MIVKKKLCYMNFYMEDLLQSMKRKQAGRHSVSINVQKITHKRLWLISHYIYFNI
jgi:hypothetical protein